MKTLKWEAKNQLINDEQQRRHGGEDGVGVAGQNSKIQLVSFSCKPNIHLRITPEPYFSEAKLRKVILISLFT